MLNQMSPRERFGYAALILAALFVFGYVGAQQLKRPPEIKIEPLPDEPKVSAATATEVIVHVAGAVKSPGLLRFEPGKRVDDAIKQAGGAKAEADLEALNLAAKLEDGTQLFVPSKGKVEIEKVPEPYRGGGSASYSSKPATSPTSSSRSSKDPSPSSISLNTASQAQLESLPGIGPVTAKKILEYRQAHGGFSSVEELLAVKGIGPKKLEAVRKFVKL